MDDLPQHIQDMIGKELYPEEAEFPVEHGYIWTTCSSVENGNPLFWDESTASELSEGPIAPPTMISVWLRPHQGIDVEYFNQEGVKLASESYTGFGYKRD
jgi:hypothetical protein